MPLPIQPIERERPRPMLSFVWISIRVSLESDTMAGSEINANGWMWTRSHTEQEFPFLFWCDASLLELFKDQVIHPAFEILFTWGFSSYWKEAWRSPSLPLLIQNYRKKVIHRNKRAIDLIGHLIFYFIEHIIFYWIDQDQAVDSKQREAEPWPELSL